MTDKFFPRNVLISLSNKQVFEPLIRYLGTCPMTFYSTGGTQTFLRDMGIQALGVESVTRASECLDGRVKTLHPGLHAGILAQRDRPLHLETLETNRWVPIDMVIVNLYPFEETIRQRGTSFHEAIEDIDIGGCALLRSAAKNHAFVTVVVDAEDSSLIIEALKAERHVPLTLRRHLAFKAFEHTAHYDAAIAAYMQRSSGKREDVSSEREMVEQSLRYGENPHQMGKVFYNRRNALWHSMANPSHGKALSYNNFLDSYAAIDLLCSLCYLSGLDLPNVCVIIKHGNPCGVGTAQTLKRAITLAYEGDKVSSYGGIVACSRVVTSLTARCFEDKFVEVILAPGYTQGALACLKQKKNRRIITFKHLKKWAYPSKTVTLERSLSRDMILRQHKDSSIYAALRCVTETRMKRREKALYIFSYTVVKHLKSNAVCIGYSPCRGEYMLLGMGAGQPNRVDAIRQLALPKAIENLSRMYPKDPWKPKMNRAVLASDAFFPFEDNVIVAHKHGITKVIQPGGSLRDDTVIKTCNNLHVSMVFTDQRHFLH